MSNPHFGTLSQKDLKELEAKRKKLAKEKKPKKR